MSYAFKGWSYTSLTGFETCPRQYFHQKIAKDIPFTETEAMRFGNQVHKSLEDYVRDKKPMPPEHSPYAAVGEKFLDMPGTKVVEKEMCVTNEWQPTDYSYRNPSAWCRGKGDIIVLQGDKMFIGDYKTGKVKDDPSQMQLMTVLGFMHYPEVQVSVTSFIWLKQQPAQYTMQVYKREDMPSMKAEFERRVEAMALAHESENFPPRPSGLCKAHCPVKQCGYYGKGRR